MLTRFHLMFLYNLQSIERHKYYQKTYQKKKNSEQSAKIDEKNKDKDYLDRYKTYFDYDTTITESYDKYKNNNELY